MPKRAIIIHGFSGHANSGWKPWLKARLEERGWNVSLPQMPNAEHPSQAEWVKLIGKLVGKPGKSTFLIGHSLGCVAILRYLQGLPAGSSVGGVVLIAGPVSKPRFPELAQFFLEPFDWKKIKSTCPAGKIIAINSDDDPLVHLSEGRILAKELGAKLVICKGRGHFASSQGINELQEALDSVLELGKG